MDSKVYSNVMAKIKSSNITNVSKMVEDLLVKSPNDFDLLNFSGYFNYLDCDFEKAKEKWEKSLKLNTFRNSAQTYLKNLNDEVTQRAIEHYYEGTEFFKNNDFKNALYHFILVTQKKEQLIRPYLMAGECLKNLKDFESSKEYFQKALERDKENKIALNELNIEQETKEKGPFFKILLILMVCVTLGLGLYHFKGTSMQKKEKEKQELLKIAELNQKISESKKEIQNLKKDKLSLQKQNQELQKQNEDLVKEMDKQKQNLQLVSQETYLGTKELQGFIQDGETFFKRRQFQKAVESFEKLYHHSDPKKSAYYRGRGLFYSAQSYNRLNNLEKAKVLYETYVKDFKMKDYYAESLYTLGIIYYNDGDLENAQKFLKQLQRDLPKSKFNDSKVKSILSK